MAPLSSYSYSSRESDCALLCADMLPTYVKPRIRKRIPLKYPSLNLTSSSSFDPFLHQVWVSRPLDSPSEDICFGEKPKNLLWFFI